MAWEHEAQCIEENVPLLTLDLLSSIVSVRINAGPIKTRAIAREKLNEERRALTIAITLGKRRRPADNPHTIGTCGAFEVLR